MNFGLLVDKAKPLSAVQMSKQTGFLVLVALLFGGCTGTTAWNLHGKTQADLDRDHAICQRVASGGISEEHLTNAGSFLGQASGGGSGSKALGSAGLALALLESVGYSSRFKECMSSKQYSVHTPTSASASPPASQTMACQVEADCATGQSCRSKQGGGTECRAIKHQ